MNNGLIVKNVSKHFGEIEVLQDIRASVAPGKITAFIGPNGAGKTTLLDVIAGTILPDTGNITLGGINITGYPAHTIAQLGIGRQFQDVRVFKGMSVLENVIVAALPESAQWAGNVFIRHKTLSAYRRTAKAEALRWLDYVDLADHKNKMAGDLSLGQQKLLSIARLFSRKSRVLLLDEPTAGLSYKITRQITSIISKAAREQGVTVVLVEHNMSVVAELSYWIHFMHEGRIAFSGEREHVLGNQNVREIYMGL